MNSFKSINLNSGWAIWNFARVIAVPIRAGFSLPASCQGLMSFTIENEKLNRMFLDVQIICEENMFSTSVYRKPNFSRVYPYFNSFLPSNYKFGTLYKLPYRWFWICSSWTKLHTELVCLKEIFLKNGDTENSINVLKDLWITYSKRDYSNSWKEASCPSPYMPWFNIVTN